MQCVSVIFGSSVCQCLSAIHVLFALHVIVTFVKLGYKASRQSFCRISFTACWIVTASVFGDHKQRRSYEFSDNPKHQLKLLYSFIYLTFSHMLFVTTFKHYGVTFAWVTKFYCGVACEC